MTGWNKWGWGFIVSAILGVYTHYFFWLMLLVEGLYGVWSYFRRTVKKEWLAKLFFANGLAGVAVVPWVVFAVSEGLFNNMAPNLTRPNLYGLMAGIVNYLVGYQSPKMTGIFLSLWPVAIMGVILFLTTRIRTKIRFLGYFMMWAILPWALTFLVSFWKPVFLPRYLIFTLPAIIMLVSWMLVEVFNYKEKGCGLLATALIMLALFWQQGKEEVSPVVENYQAAVMILNTEVGVSDKIVVSSPFTIIPLEYQFKKPNRIETVPP